tara:strand:+ start:3690 stop:3995 length:306 start_codon:yes stop_codon:yes gene_type:complete
MLTSTLVTSSALDVTLPKSKAQTVKKSTVTVTINKELQLSVNENILLPKDVEIAILNYVSKDPEAILILRVDKSVPTGEAVRIMDIAYRNKIKMVLATDPK